MTFDVNKYGFGQNPPYSLYQAETGQWGLIDKDGNKLEAVFKLGENGYFSSTPYEVVTFDEEEGFAFLVWGEPWWETVFSCVDFPEELNHYLEGRFKSRDLTEQDKARITDVLTTAELNDLQRQIIEDLIFFMEYDKMGYDDEADEYEKEWFSKHPMIDTELRIATLAEMIRTFGFDADTNESLWFANFRFIDVFAFGH